MYQVLLVAVYYRPQSRNDEDDPAKIMADSFDSHAENSSEAVDFLIPGLMELTIMQVGMCLL